jgi:hypothetical protein
MYKLHYWTSMSGISRANAIRPYAEPDSVLTESPCEGERIRAIISARILPKGCLRQGGRRVDSSPWRRVENNHGRTQGSAPTACVLSPFSQVNPNLVILVSLYHA